MRIDYTGESERLRRSTFLIAVGVLVAFFAVLGARLWILQVVRGDYYREESENNRIKSYRIPAPRGWILDRGGEKLVDYAPSYDVFFVPEDLPDDAAAADQAKGEAARICSLSRPEFDALAGQARRGRPVRVLTDASREALTGVEEARMRFEGRFPLEIETVSKRVYTQVGMLSHFLGYCGEIDEATLAKEEFSDYRPGDLVGRTGIEQAFESQIRGRPGRDLYEENARRARLRLLAREAAVPGNNLVLSVDARIQEVAMRAFNYAEGVVVAVDPKTGFILAAHSAPTFDTDIFSRATPRRVFQELLADPMKPLQNRITAGAYPPGSTFKPFMAAAGLQSGVANAATTVGCSGTFYLGGWPFRCWKHAGHGAVDLKRGVRESCDVFFYTLGQRMGIDAITKYAEAFGFGSSTALGLIGERAGVAPSRAWKKKRYDQAWMGGDTISVSIGQGYNVVTPIQLAMGYAALVNGGRLMRPQVVTRVEDPRGKVLQTFTPEVVREVGVSAKNLDVVRGGMVSVVMDPGGTASRARVKGFTIGGKTGTAQVVVQRGQQTKNLNDVEYARRDHAWFVGYGPAEDPRIVVVVLAEHSGHGGSAAAPIAQQVLQAYLDPGHAESVAPAAAAGEDPDER
jgi:penicillin-binding protein 2